MIDRKTTDLQASYDLVADEYVRRIFDELEHKPLDRQLLDRFAARVRPSGLYATWAAGLAMWLVTSMHTACWSMELTCRP